MVRFWATFLFFMVSGLWPLTVNAGSISDVAGELSKALASHIECGQGKQVKVGIWPFNSLDLPISEDSAHRVYSQVLTALTENKPQCMDLIEVAGVAQAAQLMSSVSGLSNPVATSSDIFKDLKDVDYILAGTILSDGPNAFALFKLSDRKSGALLFESSQASIPLSSAASACSEALPIQVAIDRLARDMRSRASELQHLVVEGGYYTDTSGRTGFSQYLEPLLVGAITKAFENTITDRRISVRYVHSEDDNELMKVRGLSITAEKLDKIEYAPATKDAAVAPSSVFRLSFRYWPCQDTIRLVVNLMSAGNRLVSWSGGIRKVDVPDGVSLEPVTPTEVRDWGPDGAFSFRMTSRRGPAPTFKAGDSFEALFLLSRDAWLYCFYTDASGNTTQILPNPTQISRTAPNFYKAGQVYVFPDKERLPESDPFQLTINANTVGIEKFRCFATSRNVMTDLPEPLRGLSFAPLSQTYAARLREIFEQVQGASMSTASMTVTVLE